MNDINNSGIRELSLQEIETVNGGWINIVAGWIIRKVMWDLAPKPSSDGDIA